VIEERIDDAFPTAPGLNRVQQVFWGARYVDDLAGRRTDRRSGANCVPDEDYADANEQMYWALTDAQVSVRGLHCVGGRRSR
jgi:hypothetical protein